MPKARQDGECDGCGCMEITKGVTYVRYRGRAIEACEYCDPSLLDEFKEEEAEVRQIAVVVNSKARYRKPDGSWFVYAAKLHGRVEDWMPSAAHEKKDGFSLCGPVGDLTIGDVVLVSGKFKTHPRHGFQFEALTKAQVAFKASEKALKTFLTQLPQIGDERADAIVQTFGLKGTIAALDDDPEQLLQIPGLTEERINIIKEAYDREEGYKDLRLFAATMGIPERAIAKSIEAWKHNAMTFIHEDPFALLELDIDNFGFKAADEIFSRMGKKKNTPLRCAAGMEFVIRRALSDGSTYLKEALLNAEGRSRVGKHIRDIGLSSEEAEIGLKELEKERKVRRHGTDVWIGPVIVRVDGRVYLCKIYDAEHTIAGELFRIVNGRPKPLHMLSEPFDKGMTPNEEQLQAVELSCTAPVSILTGGPGTGKSQTTRGILRTFEASGLRVACCAPTGKAAMRLGEATGTEASTIHRLIRYHKTSSDTLQIEAGAIILDEASMVDTELMAAFLMCVRTGTRLVIVGDVNQLPSIGPGRVLYDLIEDGRFPTTRLEKVYRQGENSRIAFAARDVNNGDCPDLALRGTDFVFSQMENAEEMQDWMVDVVVNQIPAKYGFTHEEIQVLSPQKGKEYAPNWNGSVSAMNHALQDKLNPPDYGSRDPFIGGGYVCRSGDRVLQTRNNYDLDVVNGEQGIVWRASQTAFRPSDEVITSYRTKKARELRSSNSLSMSEEEKRDLDNVDPKEASSFVYSRVPTHNEDQVLVIVDYGTEKCPKLVGYAADEVRQLELAYAVTVHKYQGSEAKAVVFPTHMVHRYMLTRSLLYTAMTRAKEYLLVVGQGVAFDEATQNTRGTQRTTSLRERIGEEFNRPEEKVESRGRLPLAGEELLQR